MSRKRPDLWSRLQATWAGEVSADLLEAYHRAGTVVYELVEEQEQRRFLHQDWSRTPLRLPRNEQLASLCTWNAFALQTLGDALLEYDARANPETVAFLPRTTAEQAKLFYQDVADWLTRARLSQSQPDYHENVSLPALLPGWADEAHHPQAYVEALVHALESLGTHIQAAALEFEQRAKMLGLEQYQAQLMGQVTAVEADAEYARDLFQPPLSPEATTLFLNYLRPAIEKMYRMGQLLAMPILLEGANKPIRKQKGTQPNETPVTDKVPTKKVKSKGQRETPTWRQKPWCMSDPRIRTLLLQDRQMLQAVKAMWDGLADPERAYRDYKDILRAFDDGRLLFAIDSNGEPVGHDHEPPYSAVYIVVQDCILLGQLLKADQMIMMSRGPGPENREFRILVGEFGSTQEVEYRDVEGAEDHL